MDEAAHHPDSPFAGPARRWFDRRRTGVLLAMNALGDGTDGALGAAAGAFMEFLRDGGFSVWQMLPVHPPDFVGSPYQSRSAHAGDPRLINCRQVETAAGLAPVNGAEQGLDRAREAWLAHTAGREQMEEFRAANAGWIDDYVLFSAIHDLHGGQPWWSWPEALRQHDPAALQAFASGHGMLLEKFLFEQFVFFDQWRELRTRAVELGILLLGDMPLYVAHDSAEVWAHRKYFALDGDGQAVCVAGVPPDAFSATGQRWGNPCYQWQRMQADGFAWWIERVRTQLRLFDLVRFDHFRGLESVWEIPAHLPTAEHGEWRPVPGAELLQALHAALGRVPIIAEDLGVITPAVVALRNTFRLPGIKVLQFAFDGDAANPYLPHNHAMDFLICTGTHDNNTTVGWFEALPDDMQRRVNDYLGHPEEDMPWPLIRAALASVCTLAVIPMQDLLGLDAAHRTNTPGTTTGNWQWRLDMSHLTPELRHRARHLNELYGRT